MTIKHLVLSSGAYKGFYTIGVIKHLLNKNFFKIDDIENIYGSSVGSIIGVLLCLKLDWDDIVEYTINRPWHKQININTQMLLDTFTHKGYFSQDFFTYIFSGLFHNAKLSKNITFKELYDYSNINLNIYTVNLNNYELETLNHKITPDLKVIQGLHMSCAIPFIFQPVFYKECIYGDSGLINPYPVNKCIEDKCDIHEILSIRIIDNDISPIKKNSSILYYGFYLLFNIVVKNYKNIITETLKNEVIIPATPINIEDAKDIVYNCKKRKKMIENGEDYARIFLYNR
jgi:predicted acylesterase/phospholipase RssA